MSDMSDGEGSGDSKDGEFWKRLMGESAAYETIKRSHASFVEEMVRIASPTAIREIERHLASIAATTPSVSEFISAQFASFTKGFNEYIKPYAEQARELFERFEIERRLSEALAQRGWLMIPMFPTATLKAIEAATLAGDIDRVDALLVEYYRNEAAAFIAELAEDPYCGAWLGKIESAYNAHLNGSYDLAVPLWLIIIDGVARTIANDQNFKLYTTVQSVTPYGRRLSKLLPADGAQSGQRQALIQVLWLMSRGAKDRTSGLGVNRAAVIHGFEPDFGTERESLQCINTLLMLCVLGGRPGASSK